jgi:hypothetical protein
MECKLKHPYQLNPVTGVEIEVVRVRWSNDNKLFSRNTFVTIRVKGDHKSIYRILKGVTPPRISDNRN